jgi:23S rRNA A2030 N6-methylase RlmJ
VRPVANRHYAKLADVWKHLPLTEILATTRPRRYWESHAGSAAYTVSADAERRYGAVSFVGLARTVPELASSHYLRHLRELNPDGAIGTYPGSSLLAMLELRGDCSYVLCEKDAGSCTDLADWSSRLGIDALVVPSDGNSALYAQLADCDDTRGLVAHIDPYDPWQAGPGGVCALDLAAAVADAGGGLVYWYGYSEPAERAWAFDELARRVDATSLWCGDILVESRTGSRVRDDGDLGEATTPGTGFGIVTANVAPEVVAACRSLGVALSAAYSETPLPDGTPGRLDFVARSS